MILNHIMYVTIFKYNFYNYSYSNIGLSINGTITYLYSRCCIITRYILL